jgi:hypothetical protein
MTVSTTARALIALLVASSSGLTVAQAADATGCTPQEQSNQTLSQKLDQTKGVICPPDIDPGMKAPTPKTGNTPVIPPPGSPGGDPSVQPK